MAAKVRVEHRLEPQCLDDPGLQIVADDRFGNPAEVRQGSGLAFDPIWQSLTEAGHSEGQRRVPEETAIKIWAARISPVCGSIT